MQKYGIKSEMLMISIRIPDLFKVGLLREEVSRIKLLNLFHSSIEDQRSLLKRILIIT